MSILGFTIWDKIMDKKEFRIRTDTIRDIFYDNDAVDIKSYPEEEVWFPSDKVPHLHINEIPIAFVVLRNNGGVGICFTVGTGNTKHLTRYSKEVDMFLSAYTRKVRISMTISSRFLSQLFLSRGDIKVEVFKDRKILFSTDLNEIYSPLSKEQQ